MNHEHYMQRCIQLAKNGLGNVAPNPMVGCVIVHDSKIIGEGYHREFGSHHAEVNAIHSVKNKKLLAKSILYVSLEPCSHHGKTPPCTDIIIKYKIPEVVIGIKDPFHEVKGSGIKKLKDAGIKVTTGILADECKSLNKRFFTFQNEKRPYIILKWAQSTDGFIAPGKTHSGKNYKISNEHSQMLVHKWRGEEAAIMVGTKTALLDNPRLDVRKWTGKNPVRIVIDKNLSLPRSLHLFDSKTRTIVFTSKEKKPEKNIEFLRVVFRREVPEQIMFHLYKQNIQSVIIEGGAKLLNSFIEKKYWDEARVFTSDKTLGSGVKAPSLQGRILSSEKIANDTLTIYSPT